MLGRQVASSLIVTTFGSRNGRDNNDCVLDGTISGWTTARGGCLERYVFQENRGARMHFTKACSNNSSWHRFCFLSSLCGLCPFQIVNLIMK